MSVIMPAAWLWIKNPDRQSWPQSTLEDNSRPRGQISTSLRSDFFSDFSCHIQGLLDNENESNTVSKLGIMHTIFCQDYTDIGSIYLDERDPGKELYEIASLALPSAL